jgi:hypothetical protein
LFSWLCAGLWEQHILQLLQLAEVYLRCQHLSRVVGLEAGQLLAAVVPTSATQLLHVFSSRELTAGLAALVITRCKALRVLAAETLEQRQQGQPQAHTAASASAADHLSQHDHVDDSSSSSGSDGAPDFTGRHNSRGTPDSDGASSDGDDSVSISSWCSTSSSILDSPGVLLHEKHLAVGGMALHMMEQATAWLKR